MIIATEKDGTRVYITGETYAVRDTLREGGCLWDHDRRQWWIGAAKANTIADVVGRLAAAPAPTVPENLDGMRVQARVEYHGRPYFQVAEARDGSRLRLVSLDGSRECG